MLDVQIAAAIIFVLKTRINPYQLIEAIFPIIYSHRNYARQSKYLCPHRYTLRRFTESPEDLVKPRIAVARVPRVQNESGGASTDQGMKSSNERRGGVRSQRDNIGSRLFCTRIRHGQYNGYLTALKLAFLLHAANKIIQGTTLRDAVASDFGVRYRR